MSRVLPKRKAAATPSATPALAFKSPAVQRGVVTPSPQRSVAFSMHAADEAEAEDDEDDEEDGEPSSEAFDPLSPPVPKNKRGSDPARKMTSDADMEAAEALAGLRGEDEEEQAPKKGKGRAKPVKDTAVTLPGGRKLGARRSAAEKKAAAARLGPVDSSAPVAGPSKPKPAPKSKAAASKGKKTAEPESSRPRRGAVKPSIIDITPADLAAQAEAEFIESEEDSDAEDAIPDPAAAAAARKKAAAADSKKRKAAEASSSNKRQKSQSAPVVFAPAESAPTSSDDDDEGVEMDTVDPTPAAPPAGQVRPPVEAPVSDASGAEAEPTQAPEQEQEEEESSDDDDGETFVRSQYAARTRVVDGQLVIDEDSLQVDRAHETTVTGEVVQDDLRGRFINSATYGKRTSAGRWTTEETDRFYSNFDMISTLLPGRSRSMCIRKFNVEDKANRARVNAALKANQPIDVAFLNSNGIDLDAPLPNAKEPAPAPATKSKKRKGKKSKEVVEPAPDEPAEQAAAAEEAETAPAKVVEEPLFNADSDDEDMEEIEAQMPQIRATR